MSERDKPTDIIEQPEVIEEDSEEADTVPVEEEPAPSSSEVDSA
jgi:hypothetical protein